MSPFNLETCARPNILALEPYRCAREYVHALVPPRPRSIHTYIHTRIYIHPMHIPT